MKKAFQPLSLKGLKTVGLAGADGGQLATLADIALVVDAQSVPRIQEVHITIGHVLCDMVDRMLFQHPL